MTPPPLLDAAGRPFPLDRLLGSGGEGAVFALPNDAGRVAKVYHTPPADKGEKLAAMIALAGPQLTNVAAWPTGLLFHAHTRQATGFVMPRLVDYQEIWRLYHPVERLKCFPRAGWAFQVRAATNLAAAFDEVHKTGCVIGDVQLRNAHVSPQALVRLVDCDSFQVRANGKQYLCEVGLPHYIPPELQGKPLRNLVRTENHDRFGLAVLIFQLLFVGRHPYAGVYTGPGDPRFEQLITEFRFAQGPLATLDDIPPGVGTLFRRAFERGGELGSRPRPDEWTAALRHLEQQIVECVADPGHKHWRGAAGCVWCRLAAKGGPEYYYRAGGEAETFAVDEAKLHDVLRRLAAARPVEFPYDRDRLASHVPPEPTPLPDALDEHQTMARVLSVAIGVCVLAMPLGLFRGFLCVAAFLGAATFAVWLAILAKPFRKEADRRHRARHLADDALVDVENEWHRTVYHYRQSHSALNRRVYGLVGECRDLAAEYQAEIQQLTAHAEEHARLRHLRLHLIADADVPNVGPTRKQALAACGIFSAADVETYTVRAVTGFGDALTGNLMAWKADVLRKFRFDPLAGLSPAEQKATAVRFRTRQRAIMTELDRTLAELEALGPVCRAATQRLLPELTTAVADWEQAVADCDLLRGRRW